MVTLHLQVHEHGQHSLAPGLRPCIDRVVEVIKVWLVLLAIHIMQDLHALLVLCKREAQHRVRPPAVGLL